MKVMSSQKKKEERILVVELIDTNSGVEVAVSEFGDTTSLLRINHDLSVTLFGTDLKAPGIIGPDHRPRIYTI